MTGSLLRYRSPVQGLPESHTGKGQESGEQSIRPGDHASSAPRTSTDDPGSSHTGSGAIRCRFMVKRSKGVVQKVSEAHQQTGQNDQRNVPTLTNRYCHLRGRAKKKR